jgi:septum formation protein
MAVNYLPPFRTISRLILASASPRRRSLLQELGLDFEVMESQVEEKHLPGETPREFVQRAACEKAGAVSCDNIDAWVLGADTVVECDNMILGKPRDADHATEILQTLSGRSHLVHTGFCLHNGNVGVSVSRAVTTVVYFSPLAKEIVGAYVATGEPQDKAGGYGIQGCGGFLVEKIKGSYSNVVGLPLAEVVKELLCHRVIAPSKSVV